MERGSHSPMTAVQHAQATLAKLQDLNETHSLEDLKAIETVAASLSVIARGQMNFLQRINRIPVETLSRIFAHVCPRPITTRDQQLSTPLFYWPSTSVHSIAPLISLTHVCRHWREVALVSPLLWTTFHDRPNRRQPAPYLERAQTGRLQFFLDAQVSRVGREVLAQHSSRISELYIFRLDGKTFDILNASKLPSLRHLTISECYRARHRFLDVNLPRLQSLTLKDMLWIPQLQTRSDTLSHLCIHYRFGYRGKIPSLEDFFTFLEHCRRLEDIVLSRFSPQSSFLSPRPTPVRLRRLRRLTIGDVSAHLMALFLTHIRNRRGLVARVFGMQCGVSDDFAYAYTSSIHPPRRLQLSTRSIEFAFTAVDSSTGIRIERRMCPLGSCPADDCSDWAENLWTIWDLGGVEELWLDEDADRSEYVGYAPLLRQLRSLRKLVLCQDAAAGADGFGSWLTALTGLDTSDGGDDDDEDEETVAKIFCPELKMLHIHVQGAPMPPSFLIDFCAARAQLGHPLEHLLLEFASTGFASLSDAEWASFEDFVGLVEYRFARDPPRMEVPVHSFTDCHPLWIPWR